MAEENKPSRAELLKEYELCQADAQDLESTVWRTGAVIGIGSIGTLIVVANHPSQGQPPWQVAAIIGALVFLTSIIWWYIARRWWSIQHAFFMRMRHIEEQLGLYQARYIQYLDDPSKLPSSGLPSEHADEIRRRAKRREGLLRVHQRRGIQGTLMFLPVVILIPWAVYTCWLYTCP
jgi:hypothetical protein